MRSSVLEIRRYVVLYLPYDVYGEDLSSSLFSQKKLQTDDLIPAGRSKEIYFGPFLEQSMKSVKLYVYSVYFEDETEWGNREAIRSEILKYGKQLVKKRFYFRQLLRYQLYDGRVIHRLSDEASKLSLGQKETEEKNLLRSVYLVSLIC